MPVIWVWEFSTVSTHFENMMQMLKIPQEIMKDGLLSYWTGRSIDFDARFLFKYDLE